MKKKQSSTADQPATQQQLESVIDTIREMGGTFMQVLQDFRQEFKSELKEVKNELKNEIKDFRLEEKLNWEEQRQFNQDISRKVDLNTDSIRELDQKVRYQKDMPERLEHVENQQYQLTRRVRALENKK